MGCGASGNKYATKTGDAPGSQASEGSKDKHAFKKENAEYQQTMQFLMMVPLLKRLPADQHPILAAATESVDFKAGEVVVTQGDAGAEFYVIREGSAIVSASGNKVATLKAGDYFGEAALLSNEPRTATVTAESALRTVRITREKFNELGLPDKLQFANRKAVGGGNNRVMETKAPTPKTDDERLLIKQALRQNVNLQTMAALDDSQVNALIDVAWKESVRKDHAIITEGDIVADYFYIVQSGSFEVLVKDEDAPERHGKPATTCVSVARPCGSFGELALLYLVPRAATVVALEESEVWVIDRGNFKNIIIKTTDAKLAEYVNLLNSVEVLSPLLQEEKHAVAKALVEMHFIKDEVILRQGDPGSTFYILYEGQVQVFKDGSEQARLDAGGANPPKMFGERALLNNDTRAASIIVSSPTAKVLALDRDSFTMLLGPLQDIIEAAGQNGGRTRPCKIGNRTEAAQGIGTSHKINREDLKKIGLLGCGGFGAVELWEHRQTGETYAMKILSKGYIVKTGMQESVMNEKNILMMTNSPFIIKLFATYNGTQMLYFLLEPALGGELYATYSRKGLHGSERHARYNVAGVVLAFEHCHARHIIYRDLKPENLLFNEKGHVKLTDMGLAKFVIGKTFTTCGTPDYFAPELITSSGHTNAVDWWTLGVLLFELLTGHPPFEAAFPMQIYSKVLKGISKVSFPGSCQGNAETLVRTLLRKEPSERLPMRPGGTANIKTHPWYKRAHFDWDAMDALTLTPPYVPIVRSKTDIANFTARKEDMPRMIEYHPDGSNWDKGFATST